MNSLFDEIFRFDRLDRVAVLFEQRKIKYAELRELTIQIAETLNGLGIIKGDRVAVLLADSPEFVASFVAAISLGAVAVPINPALRPGDQLLILKDCGASIAIVEQKTAQPLFGESHASQESTVLKQLLMVRRNDDNAVAEAAGLGRKQAASLCYLDDAERRAVDSEFPAHDTAVADAFILYTSGSTGEPKGAVHTHADIFSTNETYCREVLNLREGDRLFSSSRLPFAYGLGNSFTFPLLNGRTTVLCREKPTPAAIKTIFREAKPSIFFAVPVVYTSLLDYH